MKEMTTETKDKITEEARGNKNMVISLEQREAYSELLEILRHMEKKYVDKIPKNLIMFFYDNCSLYYEFRMTKAIGEEKFKPKTLDLLALLNYNYWSKNKSKEELIMNYAMIDEKTQAQLNAQLEKENIFTKIDVNNSTEKSNNNSLPIAKDATFNFIKNLFSFIKNSFVKIYEFIKNKTNKNNE